MKVNYKLLKKLYLIDHESGKEEEMISFILNYCYKIPNLTFSIDSKKNLFITKNTTNPENYACVVAHMDTVHSFSSAREIVRTGDILTARYIGSKMACGLNADDCNGILVALQLLEVLPNLKVCFTVEEETGGKGAYTAADNYEFFINVKFLIQADRHGSSDFITHTNGTDVVTNEFINDVSAIVYYFGYKEANGTFTDIGVLAKDLSVCGVNVSCGYYHEHTVKEKCNIKELENCLNLIRTIITTLDSNGKEYILPSTMYYYPSLRDDCPTDEELEDIPCNHCTDFDCKNCKKFGSVF